MDKRLLQTPFVERRDHVNRAVRGRRHSWRLIVKFVLAAGIVAWLCTGRLDVRRLTHVPLWPDLAGLALIVFGSMLLPAVRWWWLLRIQQIDVSLWRATKMTWVGYVAALIMPGAASGDLAKSYMILRQQSGAKARSLSTVLIDRFLGIYSLLLLGCLSAAWYRWANPYGRSLGAISDLLFALLTGATLASALALLGPTRRLLSWAAPLAWIDAWKESYQLYRNSKSALVGCLMLSLIGSILTAASLAAADRALGGAASWTASLLIGPLVVLANGVPLTPGGIGVAEATASELFNQAGSANGAEMMLAVRLIMAILSLPALLILFGRHRNHLRSSTASSAEGIPAEALSDTQQCVRCAA